MSLGALNAEVAIVLLLTGLYIVLAYENLIKRLIGLSIFQTAIFVLYISMGKLLDGTAPILSDTGMPYSHPIPHVLILTAIVVGIATLAMGLAIVVRIYEAYGSIDEDVILEAESRE